MSRTIMTVDDSRTMRALLHHTLVADGYRVETAADGVEALERIDDAAPDLLITDINMPRMDGFALIEAVRAADRWNDLPILVLSTEFSDEKKAQARSAGATGWIVKPFEPSQLRAAVRRVLV